MDAAFINNVKKTVRSFKKPYPDFKVATAVLDDGSVWLLVWENEIMKYSDSQRADILLYLEQIKAEIAKSGVRVEIGGRPGDPPVR